MPIFEYHCSGCNQEYELLIRGSEKPKCPHCGSVKAEKKFSAAAVHSGTGGKSSSLPISSGCSPNVPPCGPGCCKL